MELFVACWLVTWVAMRVPAALADVYEQRKAAKAGNWDHLTKLREARGQRPVEPPRPGLREWVRDVYHGACEDALERRAKRREAREPYDPTAPTVRQKAVNLLKSKVRKQRDGRGDTAPLPDDHLVPDGPAERMPCPGCGQTMTRSATGWTHPGGGTCTAASKPANRPPADTTQTAPPRQPARPEPVSDMVGRALDVNSDMGPVQRMNTLTQRARKLHDRAAATTDPEQAAHIRAELAHIGQVLRHHYPPNLVDAGLADVGLTRTDLPPSSYSNGGTMTAPTAPTIADVQTNEAARQAFTAIKNGAAKLAEAARLAEEARQEIAANSQAAADGMSGVRFDTGAQAAVGDINDTVHDGTLAKWSEVADQIGGAADSGLASLEKYRDAEDTVASNNVDARTLEPTAS